jgi:hypothetical protein
LRQTHAERFEKRVVDGKVGHVQAFAVFQSDEEGAKRAANDEQSAY